MMIVRLRSLFILLGLCFVFAQTNNAQPKPQAASNNIHYITDTACNFQGMIDKFRGKMIYINIWATWCSPCRADLRSAEKMRAFEKFAAGKDIVLLYLCADKDGKTWKSFIGANKLAGYHLLMNRHISKDLKTTYGENQKRGNIIKRSLYLPRHIIIDKNGMVADSSTFAAGNDKLYARLNKIFNNN